MKGKFIGRIVLTVLSLAAVVLPAYADITVEETAGGWHLTFPAADSAGSVYLAQSDFPASDALLLKEWPESRKVAEFAAGATSADVAKPSGFNPYAYRFYLAKPSASLPVDKVLGFIQGTQKTDGARIETSFRPSNLVEAITEFELTEQRMSSLQSIYCGRDAKPSYSHPFNLFISSGKLRVNYQSSSAEILGQKTLEVGTRYVVKVNLAGTEIAKLYTADDLTTPLETITGTASACSNFITSEPLWLYSINSGGQYADPGYDGTFKLYSFRLRDYDPQTGVSRVVADCIPAEKTGVAGIYDRISGGFLASATADSFIAGEETAPADGFFAETFDRSPLTVSGWDTDGWPVYYLAGQDASGGSSLHAAGSCAGWSRSADKSNPDKSHIPVPGNVYVVPDGTRLRTSTSGQVPTLVLPPVVLQGGALLFMKEGAQSAASGTAGLLTIPDLSVTADSVFWHGAHSAYEALGGNCRIAADAELTCRMDIAGSEWRRFIIMANLSGEGDLSTYGERAPGAASFVTLDGDLSGFTGRFIANGPNANIGFEFGPNCTSPGDPDEPVGDSVRLVKGSVVRFLGSLTFGPNRGLQLGANGDTAAPTIYVEKGAVAVLDGPLSGAMGFTKTGEGELVLNNHSPSLSGTIRVTAGKLSHVSLNAVIETSGTGTAALIEDGKKSVVAALTGYSGFEDDDSHGATVTVLDPADGAGCTYQWKVGDAGEWSDERPVFAEAGQYKVWCKISAEGYEDALCSANVELSLHTIAARASDANWLYDGEPHGIGIEVTDPAGGYALEWSADGTTYSPEEIRYTDWGTYTVYCRVSKTHYAPRVLSAKVSVRTAGRIYVAPNGSGVCPYATQETAAPALGEAFEIAAPGCEIEVAAGTYAQSAAPSVPAGVRVSGPADRSAVLTGKGLVMEANSVVSGLTFRDLVREAVESAEDSVISNCLFVGGVSVIYLGGTLVDSEVREFTGHFGVYARGTKPVRIVRSRIVDGAPCASGDGSDVAPVFINADGNNLQLYMEDCEVSNNRSKADGAGAINVKADSNVRIVLNRCRFENNTSRCGFCRGGGGYVTGNYVAATNCLIANNVCLKVTDGGSQMPIAMAWLRGEFVNCTITGNTSEDNPDIGLMRCIRQSQATYNPEGLLLENCIVSGNGLNMVCTGDDLPTVRHSMFPECGAGDADGNIAGPAAFIGKGDDPYRLAAGSPGINAGAPLGWTARDTDLSGRRRLCGRAVDMGCYEHNSGSMVLIR